MEYEFNLQENTIGGLTKEVLALNYGKISKEVKSWNADEVWEVMKDLIVFQLGVNPEDVTPEAKFIQDLGAD